MISKKSHRLAIAIVALGLAVGLWVAASTQSHEPFVYHPYAGPFRAVEDPTFRYPAMAVIPPSPSVLRYLTPADSPPPSPSQTPQPARQPGSTVPRSSSGTAYKPWRTFPPDVAAARAYALGRIGKVQFRCLDILWDRESRWRTTAENKTSGAYGIPQALPGTKMAKAGPDWRTNPRTQVRWGLLYIGGRYGTACRALQHSYNTGWY